ncbi:hypothetical protein DICVIV_04652 [Dictyocaulus viviparus]|uniref:Uncharacterized protein n=1 Tax=Dictyocaulus viviparus TaxID=29172 RepID=A0A0D8XZD0_DICVI|nr:hypothetical protein DICVIV_04652 [Dictyocaulus viviparus]
MDDSKALSAAERRERRLRRILGNSEERMKKILSGPDGGFFYFRVRAIVFEIRNLILGEQRLPPMLEGGEFRSSFLPGCEDNYHAPNQENYYNSPSSGNSASFQYTLFQCLNRMDKSLSLFFGIFVRMLMVSGVMFNVLTPWILIFFFSHFFTIIKEVPNFVHDITIMLQSGSCSTIGRIFRRGQVHVFEANDKTCGTRSQNQSTGVEKLDLDSFLYFSQYILKSTMS